MSTEGVGGQKKNLVHVVCENPMYGIINKLEIYLLHDSAENWIYSGMQQWTKDYFIRLVRYPIHLKWTLV